MLSQAFRNKLSSQYRNQSLNTLSNYLNTSLFSTTPSKSPVAPIHFPTWVEQNEKELLPPVSNKLIYGDGQMKLMVVGGPNQREDYHIEEGGELFYMWKGDMELKVFERGESKTIKIPEGFAFYLPPRIPHSPQRFVDTIGIVWERKRLKHEYDGLRWYVPGSSRVLYEEYFYCTDLGTQLKPVINRFFASECYKTKIPATKLPPPMCQIDTETKLAEPIDLVDWIAQRRSSVSEIHTLYDAEFKVKVALGRTQITLDGTYDGEVYLQQISGKSIITTNFSDEPILLESEGMFLIPKNCPAIIQQESGFLLMITNEVIA